MREMDRANEIVREMDRAIARRRESITESNLRVEELRREEEVRRRTMSDTINLWRSNSGYQNTTINHTQNLDGSNLVGFSWHGSSNIGMSGYSHSLGIYSSRYPFNPNKSYGEFKYGKVYKYFGDNESSDEIIEHLEYLKHKELKKKYKEKNAIGLKNIDNLSVLL